MSRYVDEHGRPIDDDCEEQQTLSDNEIIKALERCVKDRYPYGCEGCPYRAEDCNERLDADALDLINRQKAEIERLEDVNIRLTKAEAIKEFWNQRPPQLNPIQKGKELYNEGWNDCISFFAEEYEIFLGVKKREEKDDCDDNLVKEMVGDSNV